MEVVPRLQHYSDIEGGSAAPHLTQVADGRFYEGSMLAHFLAGGNLDLRADLLGASLVIGATHAGEH